jgi:hypothetical protein
LLSGGCRKRFFLKCEYVSQRKKEERTDVKTMEDGLKIVKAWFLFLFFFIEIRLLMFRIFGT